MSGEDVSWTIEMKIRTETTTIADLRAGMVGVMVMLGTEMVRVVVLLGKRWDI